MELARLRRHWQYFRYLARHKYYVFQAGLWTGAPVWRLVIHDWSKFLPSEWLPYSRKFYGAKPEAIADRWLRQQLMGIPVPAGGIGWGETQQRRNERDQLERKLRREIEDAFNRAWLKHQHRNPHHWQHWLLTLDNPNGAGPWAIMSPDGIGRYLELAEKIDTGNTGGYERWDLSSEIGLVPEKSESAGDRARRDRKYRMLSRLVTRANRLMPQEMPEKFVREMVADWAGAGRAITGRWELVEWWHKNRENIILHPNTLSRVHETIMALSAEGHIPYSSPDAGASGLFKAVKA